MFSIVDFKSSDFKDFIKRLDTQYSLNLNFEQIINFLNYQFFLSANNRIYIITKKEQDFDFGNMRIDHKGLYFCEYRNGSIRLSFEGSQLFYKLFKDYIKKNILDLDYDNIKKWISGQDIDLSSLDMDFNKLDSYVLIRHNDDIYGSGIVKDKILLNFVAKNRRLKDVFE